MKIREYQSADLQQLVSIYQRQGFDYDFPNLEPAPGKQDPLYFSKRVLEDQGQVEQAVIARMTCEIYLLMDPEAGTPEERWQKFQALHADVEQELFYKGLDDAHCWVPPELVDTFEKRMKIMGWNRDTRYTPFVKFVKPPVRPTAAMRKELKNGTR